MWLPALAVAALGAMPPVCAAAQRATRDARESAPAVPWLGCYELRVGRWTAPVDSGYALPETIRLDTAAAPAPSSPHRTWYTIQGPVPAFVARRPLLGVVGWHPVGADSVALSWSDGFVRLTARLGARGDSLTGSAYWRRVTARLDSAGHPRPSRPARAPLSATRIACPR